MSRMAQKSAEEIAEMFGVVALSQEEVTVDMIAEEVQRAIDAEIDRRTAEYFKKDRTCGELSCDDCNTRTALLFAEVEKQRSRADQAEAATKELKDTLLQTSHQGDEFVKQIKKLEFDNSDLHHRLQTVRSESDDYQAQLRAEETEVSRLAEVIKAIDGLATGRCCDCENQEHSHNCRLEQIKHFCSGTLVPEITKTEEIK